VSSYFREIHIMTDRTALHFDDSCGELSAGSECKGEDESNYTKRKSQLNIIFSVLGTPEESELRHLDSKSARDIRALARMPETVCV
jgi:hypothetical protein